MTTELRNNIICVCELCISNASRLLLKILSSAQSYKPAPKFSTMHVNQQNTCNGFVNCLISKVENPIELELEV